MPERVAYVVKVYPRFSETFVVTEILAREAAGERIEIFALRPTTDARFHPELARVRAGVQHLGKPHKLSDGWAAHTRAAAEIEGFHERWQRLWPMVSLMEAADVVQALDLAVRLRTAGITSVHAHFASLAGRVAAVAAALVDVSCTITAHAKDLFHDDVDPELLRHTLATATRIVTISEYNVAFLQRRFPDLAGRVTLVRNGLDLDRFDYRDPHRRSGPLQVLAIGRLVEKKGFDLLLDAIAAPASPGCVVRIAGAGELADALAAQVTRLGLGDRVELLGPRSQSEVRELLSAADVLVVPSVVAADGNADGLPTVVLEAMATGVPVVATDVTGMSEAVIDGDTGVLLPPGDVDALAAALLRVADRGYDLVGSARRARALVERQHDARRQAVLLHND